MDRIERIGQVAEIMRDYVENKQTFLTEKTKRVPVRSYTDPDQWKAEMELVFKRVPLMLAFTAELPNPGDYKAMDAIGMPVLINRDKSGQVRAFLNVCSHRGAPVASEGHGNCPRFTCKYHGWTFGQDGKLIGISEASKFGEVHKSELGRHDLRRADPQRSDRRGRLFPWLPRGFRSARFRQLDLHGQPRDRGCQLEDRL
jgi:phenylpropionate dioxygenase-like ring-hydroxylating dioxygenase large terminal subunit